MYYRYENRKQMIATDIILALIGTIIFVIFLYFMYNPSWDEYKYLNNYPTNTIVIKEVKTSVINTSKSVIEVTYRDNESVLKIMEFKDNEFEIAEKSYIEETSWNPVITNKKKYKLYLSEEDYKKLRNIEE